MKEGVTLEGKALATYNSKVDLAIGDIVVFQAGEIGASLDEKLKRRVDL